MQFEIKDRDAAGRICRFTTKHGTVTTPNLMPVINPNKMIISPKEMKKLFGTEIVITNSYIIKKDEKLIFDTIRKHGDGVNQKIIVNDSGYSKAKVSKVLNSLKERGVLKLERVGRKNKVHIEKKFEKS